MDNRVNQERISRRAAIYSGIIFVMLLLFLVIGEVLTRFSGVSTPPWADTVIGGLLVFGLILFIELGLRVIRDAESVEVSESSQEIDGTNAVDDESD